MSNDKQQTPDKNYWLITNKCRWEQSIGTKRIANNEEILTYGGGKQ